MAELCVTCDQSKSAGLAFEDAGAGGTQGFNDRVAQVVLHFHALVVAVRGEFG